MESLRLCHPLNSSCKLNKSATTLTVHGTSYTIPANSNVQLNFCALFNNTKIWGPTAMTWDPARFIFKNEDSAHDGLESEEVRASTDKNFFPWLYGERACPGKRFSQVELVATLAVLFRKHRVEPVPERGETLAEARKRAQKVSLDIQMTLLNQMYKPQRVGLKWIETPSA